MAQFGHRWSFKIISAFKNCRIKFQFDKNQNGFFSVIMLLYLYFIKKILVSIETKFNSEIYEN